MSEEAHSHVHAEESNEEPKMRSTSGSDIKWLMGILAVLVTGVTLTWVNNVNAELRDVKPDVAVLRVQLSSISLQLAETKKSLDSLTAALVAHTDAVKADVKR